MTKIVSDEMKLTSSAEHKNNAAELAAWLGSFGHLIENDGINDYVIALAAGAGTFIWRRLVEQYVKELEKDQNFSKASTYLLALGRKEESVEMLLKGRFYRDALTLANLQLGFDHPLVENILGQWAERSALGGNAIQAAKCKLATGDVLSAIKFLQRRNNSRYNVLALELLFESDLTERSLVDQLVNSILNPASGFGRWNEVYFCVKDGKTDVTKQIILFIYFHQVNTTTFVLS